MLVITLLNFLKLFIQKKNKRLKIILTIANKKTKPIKFILIRSDKYINIYIYHKSLNYYCIVEKRDHMHVIKPE